jgi:hypothetical protein
MPSLRVSLLQRSIPLRQVEVFLKIKYLVYSITPRVQKWDFVYDAGKHLFLES